MTTTKMNTMTTNKITFKATVSQQGNAAITDKDVTCRTKEQKTPSHLYDDLKRNEKQQDIRAKHKRRASEKWTKFEAVHKKRKCVHEQMENQIARTARHIKSANKYCRRMEAAMRNCCSRRADDFFKAQDYFEQKRSKYYTKLKDYSRRAECCATAVEAYGKQLMAYCTDVKDDTTQEDSLDRLSATVSDAYREAFSIRQQYCVFLVGLRQDARDLERIIRLLKSELITRSVYAPKRTVLDFDNIQLCKNAVTTFKFYHYR
jgi:hypothetical protein